MGENSRTPSDFDWNNLKAFLAVARTGKLTAAATRLRSDHTTVARRISAIEQSLGARLFDRSPTGYNLTKDGAQLLTTAEAMESLALTAQAGIGHSDLAVSGAVRIGAPEGFGSYFLAPRMAPLIEQYPGLQVELVAISGVLSLSKREAELAITLSAPSEGRLVARKLTDYRLGLFAAPTYLERRPPIDTLSDLVHHRLIGYIKDLLHAPELDYMATVDVNIDAAFTSSNLIAQFRAAISGVGVCILPKFIAAQEPRLLPVLADEVNIRREFWLTTHADLRNLARVKAVSAFITDSVKAASDIFLGC